MFNKTFKIFPLLAVAAILTGCAHKIWYQPGVSADQTRRDLAQCKYSAEMATRGGPLFIPGNGAGGVFLYQTISQGNQRKDLIQDCMEAKGYQFVPVSQVPTNEPASQPVTLGNHAD